MNKLSSFERNLSVQIFVMSFLLVFMGCSRSSQPKEQWLSLGGPKGNIFGLASLNERVYIITDEGLYKYVPTSNWKLEKEFYNGGNFKTLKTNGRDIFAETPNGNFMLRSGMDQWTPLPQIPGWDDGRTPDAIFTNDKKIYGALTNASPGGLFELAPDSTRWELLIKESGGCGNPSYYAVIKGTIYLVCGTKAKIFKFAPGTHRWVSLEMKGVPKNIFVNDIAAVGTDLYIGSSVGLFKSSGSMNSWESIDPGVSRAVYVKALAVNSGDLYIGTGHDGIFKLKSGSKNLEEINRGLPMNILIKSYPSVQSLFSDGANLFAGFYEKGIYRLVLK